MGVFVWWVLCGADVNDVYSHGCICSVSSLCNRRQWCAFTWVYLFGEFSVQQTLMMRIHMGVFVLWLLVLCQEAPMTLFAMGIFVCWVLCTTDINDAHSHGCICSVSSLYNKHQWHSLTGVYLFAGFSVKQTPGKISLNGKACCLELAITNRCPLYSIYSVAW